MCHELFPKDIFPGTGSINVRVIGLWFRWCHLRPGKHLCSTSWLGGEVNATLKPGLVEEYVAPVMADIRGVEPCKSMEILKLLG